MEGGVRIDDLEDARADLPLEDRWILSRLNRLIVTVYKLMEDFQFGEAQRQTHDFLWGEYCDWYIEVAKIRLRQQEFPSPVPVLAYVLETSLRLLHPFMPFITEEIWQGLKQRLSPPAEMPESIMIAHYPAPDEGAIDGEAEKAMELVIDVVRAIRNARAEFGVEPSKWIEAVAIVGEEKPAFESQAQAIETLARVKPLAIVSTGETVTTPDKAKTLVLNRAEVILPMAGMVDLDAERERLAKEIAATEEQALRIETKLKDEKFLSRAPANVVAKEKERLTTYGDKMERLKRKIAELG